MYKIMLADDEGIVINSLKFIIEKHFKDGCIIEFAKTGRSVIELAERFRPHIAIMDIQMPGINGIEAMKEIKKISPGTLFIVLSAYDKFNYAQEAVNLGALEYLTKPVNQKVIVNILTRAMERIDKEKEKRSYDLMIKEKLEIVTPIIESGLVYAILFQEDSPEDINKYTELLDIKEDFGYMMVLEYGDAIEETDLSNTVGVSIKAQSFSFTLREIIKTYFKCAVGVNMTNKTILFMPHVSSELTYNQRVKIIEDARKMIGELKEKIDIVFRLGIGSVRSLDRVLESYREAIIAMKNVRGSIGHFNDLPLRDIYEKNYPNELEKTLINSICLGRILEAKVELERYFNYMRINYPVCEVDIKLKILELVLHCERKTFSKEGMTYDFRSRKDYLEAINRIEMYEELQSWFLQKIYNICANVITQKRDQSTGCIEVAKEYIRLHYQRNISLEEVSGKVGISPYYFSKMFKEVTGENFIEYVTKIRIETAKELLHSGMSIKEVCISVGYNDPNYFSRTFKKSVGITPTEFKEASSL